MKKLLLLATMFSCSVILMGCAAGTSKLQIDPNHAYVASQETGNDAPSVFIGDIIDARIFSGGTGNPADPTPDIKSAAQRNITIGRKRGGFGNALGSIELKDGKTVTGIMRTVIENAFTDSGFKVIHDEASMDKNTIVANCSIMKFWCWTKMGFWQGYLVTDIAANIKISNDDIFPIEVSEHLGVQLGTESNAMISIHNAISKFHIATVEKLREYKQSRSIEKNDDLNKQ